MRVDAKLQTLVLEAGTTETLYDAFGMPNMHLSYGVVHQTVNALADARYILQVLALCVFGWVGVGVCGGGCVCVCIRV